MPLKKEIRCIGRAGLGLGDLLLSLRVHIITELSRGSLALTSTSAPPLLRPKRPLLGSYSPCRLTYSADCEPNDPNTLTPKHPLPHPNPLPHSPTVL